mgnify:CR=1 FL=1
MGNKDWTRRIYEHLTFDNTVKSDAFGRSRVTQPITVFDSQCEYDKQPLLWVEKSSGTASATHKPFESAVDLTLGTASGDLMIRQTREYFRYQPGKSQLIMMTFALGEPQSNTTKLVGYGDDKNGVFLGQDGGGTFVLLRSKSSGSVDDTRKVYQEDWNVDRLNGEDFSKITADWTKTHIFVADIEWLGVGRVRIGLNIDGITYNIHEFLNANILSTTYMTTANLPCRYEIRNTGVVAAAPTLKQICTTVVSEGGLQDTLAYPFSTEILDVNMPNGAGNAICVFAARHALTFNSIENRVRFDPSQYEIAATGGTVVAKVIYNPTLVGGTWGAVNAQSAIEGSSDIGAGFSGGLYTGTSIITGGQAKSAQPVFGKTVTARLPFGLDVDGASPVPLGLIAYATGNNVTASFAFQWSELR